MVRTPLLIATVIVSSFAAGQLRNLGQLGVGTYELPEGVQHRQEAAVKSAGTTASIRQPERAGDQQGTTRSTISIAEMKAPKKARQHVEKAAEAMREQRLGEARAETEAALAIYPAYAQALTLRGILKMDSRQMQEALQDLQAAIASDPDFAMSYAAMGAAYNALGRYEDAARSLQRAEGLEPRSWQAHFEMGKTELGRQNYAAALREVNRALELALPPFPPIRLVRARIYLKQQNYEGAIPDLEEYLRAAPQDAAANDARKTLEQVRIMIGADRTPFHASTHSQR
ncbi:MAG: tetratricopeptide repeat protein [Acidobacteria bacterium]|nr:tetratricopeptide repeat protein [Acidobacteriota bacterium]